MLWVFVRGFFFFPSFLSRLQENKQKQLQADWKIVEAPGSNACSRPLLDVINWMMHYSVDNL